jgi:predicted nucleic acid-binding protein
MLDAALQDRQVLMPPAMLSELLSDPDLPSEAANGLTQLPLLEVTDGYWQRAGMLRSHVLARRRKARLGDALIAQSCIDRGVLLLSRDRDFKTFASAADLRLVVD